MATGAYIGVSGKAAKIKKIYIGVGGKAAKVTKAYIGVGGKARLWWVSAPPVLSLQSLPSASRLSAGVQGTSVMNRGTVFNNTAFLCNDESTTTSFYVATYNASLTKTPMTGSHAIGAKCFITQCAKLPSYAILGGAYKNELGYPLFANDRKIAVNASSTQSLVEVTSGTGAGGAATQTSSYALYIGTQTHSYDSLIEDEAWESEHKISAFNDSLTRTIVNASWVGAPRCAASFGDKAVFDQGSIDDSLTVSQNSVIDTDQEFLLFANAGRKMVFQTHEGPTIPSSKVRFKLLTKSLTATVIYSDDNKPYMKNMAGGATPNAAVFVGGGDNSTDGHAQTQVLAYDEAGTDVSNSMALSYSALGMQSSVLPLGDKVLFAGGSTIAAWVVNNDSNTKRRYVYAVTEQ